jgi:hypothetical protein
MAPTINFVIITDLSNDRNLLAAYAAGLPPLHSQYIWKTISNINDEIDELFSNPSANALYVPQTDPFRAETDTGRQFIGTLNDIKSAFGTVATVVSVVEDVLKVIRVL